MAPTRAHLGAAVVGVTHKILSTTFFARARIGRAHSCDTPRMAVTALPDLNVLTAEELRALILAQHEQLVSAENKLTTTQEQLLSREREIEHLKLLLVKLHRMQFGRKSEKLQRQIEQLELRLEELESNRSQKDTQPSPASVPASATPAAAKPTRHITRIGETGLTGVLMHGAPLRMSTGLRRLQ